MSRLAGDFYELMRDMKQTSHDCSNSPKITVDLIKGGFVKRVVVIKFGRCFSKISKCVCQVCPEHSGGQLRL